MPCPSDDTCELSHLPQRGRHLGFKRLPVVLAEPVTHLVAPFLRHLRPAPIQETPGLFKVRYGLTEISHSVFPFTYLEISLSQSTGLGDSVPPFISASSLSNLPSISFCSNGDRRTAS
jgi:hypothetical protein